MGIPRLRFPRGAPSRSGLKLVEALLHFVGEDDLPSRMRAGRVAIDLGAAPGGWSQVLAARGLRVVAVDNGPIAREVLATQLVEHRREDAFRFRPDRPVDWMVCDVVAAPVPLKGHGPAGERIFNVGRAVGESGPLTLVERVGTAVLMLSRRAVDALVDDAKADGRVYERASTLAGDPGTRIHYDVFRVGVADGEYLSEDYWACATLRASCSCR